MTSHESYKIDNIILISPDNSEHVAHEFCKFPFYGIQYQVSSVLSSDLKNKTTSFTLQTIDKSTAPCKSTTEKLSFEWPHSSLTNGHTLALQMVTH